MATATTTVELEAPQLTLKELKQIVSRNLGALMDAGRALKEIRDRELWKEEAPTFQEFCVNNWGVSKQRAYQLMDSVEIVESLPKEQSTAVDSERAARELKSVPAEARAEVVKQATVNGKATGPAIKKAAQAFKDPTKAFDRTGLEIPEKSPALATWERTSEVKEMLDALSRIKAKIEQARTTNTIDILYSEINLSAFMNDVQSTYSLLKVAMPYAVCPTCQGRVLSPCTTCSGRGMVSEFYWKHKVPEQTKKIREKAVEAQLSKKGKK